MTDQDYADALAEAARLRQEAREDDAKAQEAAEDNPMWSDYLSRRAECRRRAANDRDGGMGQ